MTNPTEKDLLDAIEEVVNDTIPTRDETEWADAFADIKAIIDER